MAVLRPVDDVPESPVDKNEGSAWRPAPVADAREKPRARPLTKTIGRWLSIGILVVLILQLRVFFFDPWNEAARPSHEGFALEDAKSSSRWTQLWHEKSLFNARQDVFGPQPPNRTSVLECLQVAQPVLMPYGAANSDGSTGTKGGSGSSCTVTLMEHIFATSYGAPFVGKLPSSETSGHDLGVVVCWMNVSWLILRQEVTLLHHALSTE
jgi:hypothetical protein